MIRLFGRQDSTNVRKILWCLYELELNFEHIPAGGEFGITQTPEYLALNPNGLVPCLVDNGFVLWESNTILRYLAEKYGQGTLYIAEPYQRYQTEKWLDWCLGTISPLFRILILNSLKLPAEHRDPKLLAQALQDFKAKIHILDQQLAKQSFIGGDTFSIADIAIASYWISFKKLPIEHQQFNEFTQIKTWFEYISTRQALRQAFQKII